MAAAQDVTYPPLDTLKPVADNLWIVDSGPQQMGISLPVRMTVIRLSGGEVLLHSPTRYNEALRQDIEALGPIRHLVAPNIAHWTHLKEWQTRCPGAETSAAPNLRQRSQVQKAGVRLDRDLTEAPPEEWRQDLEQAIVPGGAGFREVAFLHKPSRTVILTDLVQNLEPEKLPPAPASSPGSPASRPRTARPPPICASSSTCAAPKPKPPSIASSPGTRPG